MNVNDIYRLIGIHHLLPSGNLSIIFAKEKSADVFVPSVARSEQKWTYMTYGQHVVPCYPPLSCWFHHWLWIQWTDPGKFWGSRIWTLWIWKWFFICQKVYDQSWVYLFFFAKTSDLLSTCFARSWIWDCFLPLISFNHPNPWRFYHIVYYMYIILYCFKLYGKSSKSNLTSIEILKSLLEIIIQNYSNHVPSTFPTICIVWGALH